MPDLGWSAYYNAQEEAADAACRAHRAKFGLITDIEDDDFDCDESICRKDCPFCPSAVAKKRK